MDDNLLGKRDYIKAKNHCILSLTYGDTFILYNYIAEKFHCITIIRFTLHFFFFFFFCKITKILVLKVLISLPVHVASYLHLHKLRLAPLERTERILLPTTQE